MGNLRNMNNYIGRVRKRGRTLLIVEGNHEKNELFKSIFRCFPEMNINMKDVWIYQTNIYVLYNHIVEEYGAEWTEDDIDLPFIISKTKKDFITCYKDDFTNIFLIFDYEHHDPKFSEDKILQMQNYFMDSTDVGKLYINYPMIESYQHLIAIPDISYAEKKVPVSMEPGSKYKDLVRKETVIAQYIEFPDKIGALLNKKFGINDNQICQQCCEELLKLSNTENIEDKIQDILKDKMEEKKLKTAKYQMLHLISEIGYAHNGESYWKYMRKIFQQIIVFNICKANRIQIGKYAVEIGDYMRYFEEISLIEILEIQNESSRGYENGFIWVLNTCVFLVAEYNFALVME